MRALWISFTGLKTNETVMDLISNNLANINTNGYKFQDAFIEELMAMKNSDLYSNGVEIKEINRNFKQGDLISTQQPLDLAIDGDGFFKVVLPDDSIGYVRNGQFNIDANGNMVTKNGYKIYPEIVIPEDTKAIFINEHGEIYIKNSQNEIKNIGEIELAKFLNNNGLKAIGNGIFLETEASGEAIIDTPGKNGLGMIKQGFLEKSNVELSSELVKLLMIQKSYEINAKVIQTTDSMLSIANSIKR